MNKQYFVMYYVGVMTILSSFAIMLTTAYWLLYPYKVIDRAKNIPLTGTEYKVGDYMYYENNYCKYMDIPAEVNVIFVDTVMYPMPEFTTKAKTGCHTTPGVLTVPNVPPGTYRIKVRYDYKVNPIRHISYEYETTEFKVIK